MTPADLAAEFQRRLDLCDVEGRACPGAVALPAAEYRDLCAWIVGVARAAGRLATASPRFAVMFGDVEVFCARPSTPTDAEHWILEAT